MSIQQINPPADRERAKITGGSRIELLHECRAVMFGGCRVNKKIIVKTIENIFVEVGHDEARKLIPAMIDIMERRIKTSLNMVAYIMASR